MPHPIRKNCRSFRPAHVLASFLPSSPSLLFLLHRYAVCGLLSTPSLANSTNKYTITARRTYLETGHLKTDDAVLNFLDALEDHKKQCEQEGKYMEARAAAKRIATLKVRPSCSARLSVTTYRLMLCSLNGWR